MTTKLLANQLHSILQDPVEGFTVELADEASLYEWKVYIEGPKDTCYEGGVFQLSLTFSKDYPMSPPVLKFISNFWHPNVYADGKVCMSILHPPGEDAMSGELAEERWLPTQSVTTIILSLMSLLNDPNCSSPANVDASVEWRKNREGYINKCKKLVERANKEKPPHIVIPHPDTNEEEHKRVVQKWKEMNTIDNDDFYEHHEDEDEEDSDEENEDEDDFIESNSEMHSEGEGEKVTTTSTADKAKRTDSVETKTTTTTTSTSTTTTTESVPPPQSSRPPSKDASDSIVVEVGSSSSSSSSKNVAVAKDKGIAEEIQHSPVAPISNVAINPVTIPTPRSDQDNSNASPTASPRGKKSKKVKKEGKKKKCIIM